MRISHGCTAKDGDAAQAIKVTRRRPDLNSGKIRIEHVCGVAGLDAFSAIDAQLATLQVNRNPNVQRTTRWARRIER